MRERERETYGSLFAPTERRRRRSAAKRESESYTLILWAIQSEKCTTDWGIGFFSLCRSPITFLSLFFPLWYSLGGSGWSSLKKLTLCSLSLSSTDQQQHNNNAQNVVKSASRPKNELACCGQNSNAIARETPYLNRGSLLVLQPHTHLGLCVYNGLWSVRMRVKLSVNGALLLRGS